MQQTYFKRVEPLIRLTVGQQGALLSQTDGRPIKTYLYMRMLSVQVRMLSVAVRTETSLTTRTSTPAMQPALPPVHNVMPPPPPRPPPLPRKLTALAALTLRAATTN